MQMHPRMYGSHAWCASSIFWMYAIPFLWLTSAGLVFIRWPGIQQDALLWIPDPVQQAGSFVRVCKGKARAFSSEPYFLMSAALSPIEIQPSPGKKVRWLSHQQVGREIGRNLRAVPYAFHAIHAKGGAFRVQAVPAAAGILHCPGTAGNSGFGSRCSPRPRAVGLYV